MQEALEAMNRRPRTPNTQAAQKGVWSWAIAGALCGAVWATVQFAPAVWLQRAVSTATDGRVQLHDSQGTLWHGSAQLGFTGGPGSGDATRLPGRVQWDVRPAWGQLQLSLRADCCATETQRMEWSPGLRSWRLQIQPGQSNWPASLLAGLGTPWNTVELQGTLALKTPGLTLVSSVDRLQLDGSLSLDMPQVSSSLSTLRPLGSYQLLLQGGEQPALDLRTLQGSLQLQGNGRWTAGHLRFTGEARAGDGHEAELSNLLNIMGRRDGARSVITLG